MLTMNQLGTLINTIGIAVIFGFVFCMVQMIMSHIFTIKALSAGDTKSGQLIMLRKQLTTGLGFLLLTLLAALILMGVFQGWSNDHFRIPFYEHPNWRRQVINETVNVVRLLVIFCVVGVGTKMVLRYREQIVKLKNNSIPTARHEESSGQN